MTKVYRLEYKQFIPADIDRCWDFFSSPVNLKKITPPSMGFDIRTGGDRPMYPGQVICYRVKPFPGFPLNWTTEITQVQEKQYFIDEQRFGPYRFWHHTHWFKETNGGTEISDSVHYALPFGWFGKLGLPIVRAQLRKIFSYREEKIKELFG
jgi:ligand-binding SRPBCC domain-containing protein